MPENISEKRVLINKANKSLYISVAVVAIVVVASVNAALALYKISAHRSVVIKEKRAAASTLKQNDDEVGGLIAQFKAFEEAPESMLGTGEKNSKIVLDALPPTYDFPALVTSLENMLGLGGYTIESIGGVDNEATEDDSAVSSPSPVEVPFTLSVSGPYDQVKNLPGQFESSIRPMHIQSMELSGSATQVTMSITAKTYYQPGKNLDLRFKEIK